MIRIRFDSCLAAAVIFAGTANADLKDGLVSYWPLDDNFADVVGGNDGIFRGSDDDPVFDTGQFNNGIVLDGVDQYVEIGGDESQFDFVNQDFSISAWFRVDAFTKNWQALIAKGEGNRWRVHRRGGESIMTWNGGNADVPAGPTFVDDEEIHHFVGVSTADEVLMYIDGELESIGPAPNVQNNSMPVMIGENPDARNRTWEGLIDDVAIWGRALDEGEVGQLWNNGNGNVPIDDPGPIPPIFIPQGPGGENTIGTRTYNGERSNQKYNQLGDPEPGLLQEWFQTGNPGSKDGVDQVFNDQDPAVEPFRAGHGSSWWTGNQAPFGDLEQYPEEVQPPLNDTNNDNYAARLTGELHIPESGTYRFADGVDDYTYLAIDADKSGVAGDVPDEVLIDDNAWTSVHRDQNNGGQGLGEIDIDVAEGGEWVVMEFNMAEGGGDDAGIIYWDYDLEAPEGQRLGAKDGFPEFPEDAIDPFDAETMYIPDTHLRSAKRDLISADLTATATASREIEFDVNGDSGEADQLVVENPDPNVFTTILDISGDLTFQIKSTGDVTSGEAFTIIGADRIVGTPTIISVDPAQTWVFDANTGRVCLDICPGNFDFDGDGQLGVGDLNLLLGGVKTGDTSFDVTGDGLIDQADINAFVGDEDKLHTYLGDANLDGEFNSTDFVDIFQAGEYEDVIPMNSTWGTGDWNGDGEFDSSDFVLAFQDGGYELGPKWNPQAASIPEPHSIVLALFAAMGLMGFARRK